MKEGFRLPIVKHLEDQDDLRQGRDAELVPGQEQLAEQMAESLYAHVQEQGLKALVFSVSSKQRAMQTAEMVREKLSQKDTRLKILSEVDTNLREIDQGTFILPENYEAGDEFAGLRVAGKIFSTETFSDNPSVPDNLDYRFGDPLLQENGECKYPELLEYFESPGESYRDILLRFYPQVIRLAENLPRYGDSIGPVVFTHGQPHQIFSNLAEVAEKVHEGSLEVPPGSLPRICWDLYSSGRKGAVAFGDVVSVPLKHATNPAMLDILKREIEILQSSRPEQ